MQFWSKKYFVLQKTFTKAYHFTPTQFSRRIIGFPKPVASADTKIKSPSFISYFLIV